MNLIKIIFAGGAIAGTIGMLAFMAHNSINYQRSKESERINTETNTPKGPNFDILYEYKDGTNTYILIPKNPRI